MPPDSFFFALGTGWLVIAFGYAVQKIVAAYIEFAYYVISANDDG